MLSEINVWKRRKGKEGFRGKAYHVYCLVKSFKPRKKHFEERKINDKRKITFWESK